MGCCASRPTAAQLKSAVDAIAAAQHSPSPQSLSLRGPLQVVFTASADPEQGHELLWTHHARLLPALASLATRTSPPPKNKRKPGPTPDTDVAVLSLKNMAFNAKHARDMFVFPGLTEAVLSAVRNSANSRPLRGDAIAFFVNLMTDRELRPEIARVEGLMPALVSAFAEPVSANDTVAPNSDPVMTSSAGLCTLADSVADLTSIAPNLVEALASVINRVVDEDDVLKNNEDKNLVSFIASEAIDVILAMAGWDEAKAAVKSSTELVSALTKARACYGLDKNLRIKCHGALFEVGLETSRAFFFAGVGE